MRSRKLKFLADENLGIQVPVLLRSLGFDIISIAENHHGISDIQVLKLANTQDRILITLDKDFGELVFKEGLIHPGIIFLRLKDESIRSKMHVLKRILKSNKNYYGKFTVIRQKI